MQKRTINPFRFSIRRKKETDKKEYEFPRQKKNKEANC
jgi:hypothetical protein